MSSESSLFGFDDVPTVNQVEICPTKRRKFIVYKRRYELSISEIQNLLKNDIANDSTTGQNTEDFENSSMFEDTINSTSVLSETQPLDETNTSTDFKNTNFLLKIPEAKSLPATKKLQNYAENINTSKTDLKQTKPKLKKTKLHSRKKTKENIENCNENYVENTRSKTDIMKIQNQRTARKILQNIENTTTNNVESTKSELKTSAIRTVNRVKKIIEKNQNITINNVKNLQKTFKIQKTRSKQKAENIKDVHVTEEKEQQLETEGHFQEAATKIIKTAHSSNAQNVCSEMVMPVTRAYSRSTRQKKPIPFEETTEVCEPIVPTIIKGKRNINKKKCKAKREQEVQLENIVEEINNKFKQVAEFQLAVE